MSGTEKGGSGTTKTPADFLKSIRGRPVVVKLNSGVDYRGFFLRLLLFFVFPRYADQDCLLNVDRKLETVSADMFWFIFCHIFVRGMYGLVCLCKSLSHDSLKYW